MSIDELKRELAAYTCGSRTNTRNTKWLLSILRHADPKSIFADLPSDGRSLWPKTDNSKKIPYTIIKMESGEFAYLGEKRKNNTLPNLLFNLDDSKSKITQIS